MSDEQWRPVPGYEGFYEVSDRGNVRGLDRIVDVKGQGKRKLRGRTLSKAVSNTGYLAVSLRKNGTHKTILVQYLVADAFLGPRPDGMQLCHNNGNHVDNRAENLRWDTRSGNMLDRQIHGTDHQRNKIRCKRGHPLDHPNLVGHMSRLGYRSCLACNRTHCRIHDHPEQKKNFQEISDSYYESIMKGKTV